MILTRTPRSASGSALLLVVLGLLLASIFVVLALNVGKTEQLTSGNDYRARLAQELADAGISLGAEYFTANPEARTNASNWLGCGTSDDFPCGAVVATYSPPDPDGAGPLPAPAAVQRKATMFYFNGGAGTGLQRKLLPLTNGITRTGGFPATQEVGAVLCRIKIPSSPTDPTACATGTEPASSVWALTLVSRGSLTNEGTSATVLQTIGSYAVLSFPPNMPPIVASGGVSVGGGLQIVSSPNAAGLDVPVSVWTRLAVTKNGTPNTCYMDEFLRQGGTNAAGAPRYYQDVMVCDTCSCPTDDSLSLNLPGNKVCQGMDIVDIDGNAANDPGCTAPNRDILREEFPEDLFAFVFGAAGWNDTNQGSGGDTTTNLEYNFAEARRISQCTFPDPSTGAPVTATLPEDTCFLLRLNNVVHIGDGHNDAAECAAIGTDSRGFIWIHSQAITDSATGATVAGMGGHGCDIKNINQIGTPTHPVALIHDGPLTQVHFKLYGLLFVREQHGSTSMSAATGGSATFSVNGGAVVYGAVVVQGQIEAGGGGNAAIVHSEEVLRNLLNDPDLQPSPTSLPGSWSDRVRY